MKKTANNGDSIAYKAIIAMFASASFAFWPNAANPYEPLKIALLDVGAFAIFFICCVESPVGIINAFKTSPLRFSIAGLLFCAAVSSAGALSKYQAVKMFLIFAGFAAIYFSVYCSFNTRARRTAFIGFIAIAGTVMSFAGILEYYGLIPYYFIPWGERVAAFFDDPNILGGYLCISIVSTLTITLISENRAKKAIVATALIPQILCLIMSYSRSAWVTTSIVLCIFFISQMILARGGALGAKKIAIAVLLSVLFISSLFSLKGAGFRGQHLIARISSISDFRRSEPGRIIMWIAGAEMALEHPVFGVGPGNLKMNIMKYTSRGVSLRDVEFPVVFVGHVYNDYITIAAEIGLTGLFCFLAIVVTVIATVLRLVRETTDTASKILLIGIGAVCVQLFLKAAAFQTVLNSGIECFLLGAFCALATNGSARAENPSLQYTVGEARIRRSAAALAVVSLALTAAAAYVFITIFISDIFFLSSKTAYSQGKREVAVRYAERAVRVSPFDEELLSYLAYTNYLAGHRDEALKIYGESSKLQPYYPTQYMHIAQIYFDRGDFHNSFLNFSKAFALVPNSTHALEMMSFCLLNTGHGKEASVYFEKLSLSFPNDARYAYYTGISYLLAGDHLKAISYLNNAYSLDPDFTDVAYAYAYGSVLSESGDYRGAVRVLRGIEKSNPAHKLAAETLSRICREHPEACEKQRSISPGSGAPSE